MSYLVWQPREGDLSEACVRMVAVQDKLIRVTAKSLPQILHRAQALAASDPSGRKHIPGKGMKCEFMTCQLA